MQQIYFLNCLHFVIFLPQFFLRYELFVPIDNLPPQFDFPVVLEQTFHLSTHHEGVEELPEYLTLLPLEMLCHYFGYLSVSIIQIKT